MNCVYLVPVPPHEIEPRLPGGWHAMKMIDDAAGRWVVVAEDRDDLREALLKILGVEALPHPLSRQSIGPSAASALGPRAPLDAATETTFDFLQRLRASGWLSARVEW